MTLFGLWLLSCQARFSFWSLVLTAARVKVYVCGSCCNWGPCGFRNLISHLEPCWCPRARLKPEPYRSKWQVILLHDEVGARTAARGHIWIHGPPVASICVDVCGSGCHQGPCGFLGTGPPPRDMLVSEGHVVTGIMPIWVACAATWNRGDIQT